MNASSFEKATEIDYLITNESQEKATAEWIVISCQVKHP